MSKLIAVLATAWGSQNGGINSFNADYCASLAKFIRGVADVICIVPYADNDQKNDAQQKGVVLISLDKEPVNKDNFEENRADQVLRHVKETFGHHPDWWLGHDVKTGPVAIECTKLCKLSQCAVFHHMDYSAYKAMDGKNTEIHIAAQRKVLNNSDVVFAIGPKLHDSAQSITAGNNARVHEIIPGLPEIKGIPATPRFTAIAFGRLSPENDRVKQAKLAVASFGRAHKVGKEIFDHDDSIVLIGLSDDENIRNKEQEDLNALAFFEAGRVVQVHGWKYIANRSQLFEHIRHASVCLMLSLHEGFGLTGWEAIAAEVPLIVAKNSGLYRAVGKILGGMGLGCVTAVDIRGGIGDSTYHKKDVLAVAELLIKIKNNYSQAKVDAINLKNILSKVCTWENAVETTVDAMGLSAAIGKANATTLSKIGVDRWQPKLLLEMLTRPKNDIVDEASKRKRMFEHIWEGIRPPSNIKDMIILFGGVASSLCDNNAAERFAIWLDEQNEAELFICYETGEAAAGRARQLSRNQIPDDGHLPNDPHLRMSEKEKQIESLRRLIANNCKSDRVQSIADRIHYIPIGTPLTNYIISLDDSLFITPLFERRSSETLTFMLSKRAGEFHGDILRYMLHHIDNDERTPPFSRKGVDSLKLRLNKIISA